MALECTVAPPGDDQFRSWHADGAGRAGSGTTTESSTQVITLTALTGVDKIAAPVGGDLGNGAVAHPADLESADRTGERAAIGQR